MRPSRKITYGEIADTILPSAIFTVDVLTTLSASVDSYVKLAPRDRRSFLQEQMERVWPAPIDWANRPRTDEFKAQWLVGSNCELRLRTRKADPKRIQALQRYFQEQGRIREPPSLPSSIVGRKWTGLRVCGIVYSDSIDEMVFLGTGMRPGDPRGYIGHRIKCRTVYYWKLPPEERGLLGVIAKEWQNGSLPVQQKTDAYYRRFQQFIKTVHLTALRDFGQHMVSMVIPEPGLTNPPRLYEFLYELKVLDRPLVKTVPVGDVLTDIYLEVNHAAGRIEGAALPTVLEKKSRLKRKTTWALHEDDFLGRDGILLRADEFDEELFFKEAIAMVYTIVRMAHSNISNYRDLDPPWSSFHDLVDAKYLLPDVPMSIPTNLRQPNCFRYLKHWFTVTKGLEFKLWQRKNSLPTTPVPMEERWWAASMADHVPPAISIPSAAQAAFDFTPEQFISPATRPPQLSPYGSAGGHLVHDEGVREDEALETLGIAAVPDPEDAPPADPDISSPDDSETSQGEPPCRVPANGEARAQWCLMIPNASLSLKAAGKHTNLPDDLSWRMVSVTPSFTANKIQIWLSFLRSSPWTLSHGSTRLFAGSELIWTYILGWIVYLRGYSAAGGTGLGSEGAGLFTLGYTGYSSIFDAFNEAMAGYAEKYSYPGWAPSTKYAVASSRSHYLAYLFRHEEYDVLLPLLKLVVTLPEGPLESPFAVVPHSAASDAPSWITNHHGVPSWQWQRCGLPPTAHTCADLPDLITEYFKCGDLLVYEFVPRSRETALAVLLKVALIHSDLENIEDEKWDEGGATILEHSTLRGHTRALRTAIADWANEQALLLEQLLPTEARADADHDAGSEGGGSRAMPPAAQMSEVTSSPGTLLPEAQDEVAGGSVPGRIDPRYWAVELEDMSKSHSVGKYQAWLAAQPRTAVQEVTRKGLEGLSQLEERRKANRAIREVALQETKRKPHARKVPKPQRQGGTWQPMPQDGSTDEDEPIVRNPPLKRQKKLIIKKPRAIAGGSKPSKASRGRVSKATPVSAMNSVSPSRSISPLEGFRPFDSYTDVDHPDAIDNDEDIEMPDHISSPRLRIHDGLAPRSVTFDAQSASSIMDIDSDDYGSARSVRPFHHRRFVFVQPEPAVFRSASSTPLPPAGDEARHAGPTFVGAQRPLISPGLVTRGTRDDSPALARAETAAAEKRTENIRRSTRLQKSRSVE
ncbi:unnamed protein product [Peniophora sp. CBMAI 1063]|nr:unnamed protein product [Peniophora sp. CBMAI 1063]